MLMKALVCRGDPGGQSSIQDLMQLFAPEEASSSAAATSQPPTYRDPDDPMDAYGPKRPNAPQVCLPTMWVKNSCDIDSLMSAWMATAPSAPLPPRRASPRHTEIRKRATEAHSHLHRCQPHSLHPTRHTALWSLAPTRHSSSRAFSGKSPPHPRLAASDLHHESSRASRLRAWQCCAHNMCYLG